MDSIILCKYCLLLSQIMYYDLTSLCLEFLCLFFLELMIVTFALCLCTFQYLSLIFSMRFVKLLSIISPKLGKSHSLLTLFFLGTFLPESSWLVLCVGCHPATILWLIPKVDTLVFRNHDFSVSWFIYLFCWTHFNFLIKEVNLLPFVCL